MMKSRGVAVIGAFVLIALAIFVRGLLTDDDSGGGSDGPKQGDGGTPIVACTPELVSVCDALADAGTIADDPPTLDLDEAAAPRADVDAWITWSPAPEIADYLASPSLSTEVWGDPEVLGTTGISVLADEAAVAEVAERCSTDAATWACLAALAADLPIGVGDPATAEGIARLAPFARALAEDDDHTTLDTANLDAVVRSPNTGQSDAGEMADQLTTQPGSVSLVVGPERLLAQRAKTAAGQQRGLELLAPKPVATLTVVLAPRVGHTGDLDGLACDDLPEEATAALEAAGLRPCTGSADPALAGFLYQVQKKVG